MDREGAFEPDDAADLPAAGPDREDSCSETEFNNQIEDGEEPPPDAEPPDGLADEIDGAEERTEEVDPGDELLATVASIRAAVEKVAAMALWTRNDAAARDGVRAGFACLQSLQAVWLALVADLDARPGAVPGARAGYVAQTFLKSALLRTADQAASDLRAARALVPGADPTLGGLPQMGAALQSGEVSREHVDVALRVLRKIPKAALSRPLPAEPTEPDTTSSPADDSAEAVGPETAPESGPETGPETAPETAPETGPEVLAGVAVDAFFAAQARVHDPRVLRRLGESLVQALDPDGADGFDERAFEKRDLVHARDAIGMVTGRFALDPASGAVFEAALDHFSAPHPARVEEAEDGTRTVIRDTRSAGQRRADALTLICTLAMGSVQAGTGKSGEPPRIVVYADIDRVRDALRGTVRNPDRFNAQEPGNDQDPGNGHDPGNAQAPGNAASPDEPADCDQDARPDDERDADEGRTAAAADVSERETLLGPSSPFRALPRTTTCEQVGPIGPRLLERFACDALLQSVLTTPSGAVLNLGRDTRTVTPAQRRALNARDRGCVIPGCTAPPQWCQGHHVIWWRNGGRTDIENLALVCHRDHTLIHLGVWDLVMIDGVPWARPPTWIDPERRLIRNTHHEDADQANHLGTQLHLTLDPPSDPPWLTPRPDVGHADRDGADPDGADPDGADPDGADARRDAPNGAGNSSNGVGGGGVEPNDSDSRGPDANSTGAGESRGGENDEEHE